MLVHWSTCLFIPFVFFYLIWFIQRSSIISRCAWLFQCNFCIQDNGRSLKLWLGIWLEDLQESVLI